MSARKKDSNGYWEIADNPISRAGVYPYLGAHLPGASDPMQVYMVLRPPEELGAPETVESFRLQPWIMRHAMLGPEKDGLTPPEDKGVHGVIGERVYFDAATDTLYGNIKGFSEELKAAIEGGEKELSAGYFHDVEWTKGLWRGQPYDAVQRTIRANHLALVPHGRMGPGVAVMDSLQGFDPNLFTITKEHTMAEDELTLEQLAASVAEGMKALTERLDRLEGAKAGQGDENAAAADEEGQKPEAAQGDAASEQPGAAQEDEDDEKPAAGQGDEEHKAGGCAARDEEGKKADNAPEGSAGSGSGSSPGSSMDSMEKGLLRRIAGRDSLAKKLVPHVGTFDHAAMTSAEVAAYGCKKLGITCAKGQERSALEGYLAGAAKASRLTFSMDAAHGSQHGAGLSGRVGTSSKAMSNYLQGVK